MTDNFFFGFKVIDEEKRIIEGYASTDTLDLEGDIVDLNATRLAVEEYQKFAAVRLMHRAQPIGVIERLQVDTKGLFVRVRVVADDAWKLVKEGVLKGFSIGYANAKRVADTVKTGVSRMISYDLIEISLVDAPANRDCSFVLTKAMNDEQFVNTTLAYISGGKPQGEWKPPEAGDAPQEVKDILKSAYESCRDKNPTETPAAKAKCARIAWGAVENAGWKKDENDKWHKPKEAAKAAGGTEMPEEQIVEEKKSVLTKLAGWLTGEPAVKSEPAATAPETPDNTALVVEIKGLRSELAEERKARITEAAKSKAVAFREKANLPPALDVALGDWYAGKSEVRMDAEGTKKLPAAEFVENLVMARGTQKLTAAVVFGEPPAKGKVEMLESKTSGEVSTERNAEIAREARAEALAAGKGDDSVFIKNLMVSKMNAEVNR